MSMPAPPDASDKSAAPPGPSLKPRYLHPQSHPRPVPLQPYYPDGRDGFISWLRGEFAAANAMIDSLVHHLQVTGDPGDYDAVLVSINQRRCNWTPVLHMQHYFPISEVVYTLKQVAWRRQQQQMHPKNIGRREYRRGNFSHTHNNNHSNNDNRGSSCGSNSLGSGRVKESMSPGSGGKQSESSDRDEDAKGFDADGLGEEEKGKDESILISERIICGGVVSKALADLTLKNAEVVEEIVHDNEKSESDKSDGCTSTPSGSLYLSAEQNHKTKPGASGIPKTFVANELFDGRMVNSADGLKLYDLLDDSEVRKLLSLVNDLRAAGKSGQFQGQTYITSKKPMRGHGWEMIQLGVPVADSPAEVESLEIHKDKKVESIPALLQDVIDRLISKQIMPVKPDSCTIDFYNEGDHSRPHSWPHWYGRPVCVLFLTECDMSFGRTFSVNHPGDFRGALKLSLLPGSLLVMQGPAVDSTMHTIPPIRKQRILVTFTKCQQKKPMPVDARLTSPTVIQAPHWGPLTPRPLNHLPHPAASKHFAPVKGTTSSIPVPSLHPQISAPNGVAPLFVAAPVVPALPFMAQVAIPTAPTGWSTVPSRHPPPPHLTAPGTGVFLPPQGSGNPSSPERSSGEHNCSPSISPNGKVTDSRKGRPEANGSVHGRKDLMKDKEDNGEGDHAVAGKQNGTA